LDASNGDTARAIPKLVSAVRLAIQAPVVTPASTPTAHTAAPSSNASQKNRTAIVMASLIGLAIAGFAAERFWLSGRRSTATPPTVAKSASAPAAAAVTIPEKSVAVLPFVDMSEKKDQEYFSDGLSEELIDKLAHSADLKVIARTSSFQFKGKNEDMRTIGQKLGVANLLEGSVRTSGKTLRITAQLINVSDGTHLWSETYDRDMADIFKVQDSIAAAVVSALQVTLARAVSSREVEPVNTEAHNAFLRGQYFRRRRTREDSDRALTAYQESVRLDPAYAPGWVGIADTYNDRQLAGWMTPKLAYTEARKAVDHALKLDPNLAAAHRTLADLEWNNLFDFDAARAEVKRTWELDPAEGARGSLPGWDAAISGRTEESIHYFQQAIQRDPLNAGRLYDLTFVLRNADRLTEAEAAARTLLDINPSFSAAHCNLGEVLLEEHKPAAALAVMRDEADPDVRFCMADALWALGRRTEADAVLTEAAAKFADTQALNLAESYAIRGDKDNAFKWLDRDYDNRDAGVTVISADPMLRNLRGDPRFAALLRKLKLPE
jgi:TolB-like protein/tetratricopeptide (TPR) repeat protein